MFPRAFILTLLIVFSPLCLGKLELVLEVFRHGAREPFGRPFDPQDWTEFEGELTYAGMRQHYLLGKEMRKRYIHRTSFLSKEFNHSEMYVRSTDVNRTLMSAESHLFGLYPLGAGSHFPSDYPLELAVPPYKAEFDIQDLGYSVLPGRFQPIPIHIVEESKDFVLQANMACPNYLKMQQAQKETEQYRAFDLMFEPIYQKIKETFHLDQNLTLSSAGGLTSDLYCSIYQSGRMPEGLSGELYRNMTLLKDLDAQFTDVGTDEISRLLSSPFLGALLDYFTAKVEGQTSLKYIIFSAHDTTIQPFLAALNLTNWQCILSQLEGTEKPKGNCVPGYPVFASQLLFELHSKDGSFFVKVFYDGVEMEVCENGVDCSFEEFSQKISRYVMGDNEFEEKCGIEQTTIGFLRKE